MKIEIINRHGDTVMSNLVGKENVTESPYQKRTYTTSEKYWTSNVSEIRVGHSHIAIHDVMVNEQVNLKTYDAPKMVGLLFMEKGSIQVRQSNHSFREIGTLQHNLVYNSQHTEETFFSPQQKLRLTMVNLVPEYFFKLADGGSASIDKMADGLYKGNGHLFATDDNLQITHPMLRLLNALDANMYNATSLRLFTEAKILELLSLQIMQIEEHSRNTGFAKLSAGDIKKINSAREFILTDLSYTPSLDEIALKAGINVFKLKTGFKILFGNSVFNYLREQRMELAYKEILKRDQSLTEIAYLSGFASISHFSDAFKKRYGVSPRQLK